MTLADFLLLFLAWRVLVELPDVASASRSFKLMCRFMVWFYAPSLLLLSCSGLRVFDLYVVLVQWYYV